MAWKKHLNAHHLHSGYVLVSKKEIVDNWVRTQTKQPNKSCFFFKIPPRTVPGVKKCKKETKPKKTNQTLRDLGKVKVEVNYLVHREGLGS